MEHLVSNQIKRGRTYNYGMDAPATARITAVWKEAATLDASRAVARRDEGFAASNATTISAFVLVVCFRHFVQRRDANS